MLSLLLAAVFVLVPVLPCAAEEETIESAKTSIKAAFTGAGAGYDYENPNTTYKNVTFVSDGTFLYARLKLASTDPTKVAANRHYRIAFDLSGAIASSTQTFAVAVENGYFGVRNIAGNSWKIAYRNTIATDRSFGFHETNETVDDVYCSTVYARIALASYGLSSVPKMISAYEVAADFASTPMTLPASTFTCLSLLESGAYARSAETVAYQNARTALDTVTPLASANGTSYTGFAFACDGVYLYAKTQRSKVGSTNICVSLDGSATELGRDTIILVVDAEGWSLYAANNEKTAIDSKVVGKINTVSPSGFYAYFNSTEKAAYAQIPLRYFSLTDSVDGIKFYDPLSTWAGQHDPSAWTALDSAVADGGYVVTHRHAGHWEYYDNDGALGAKCAECECEGFGSLLSGVNYINTTTHVWGSDSADGIDAAESGETVKLYADISDMDYLRVKSGVTLDLNGHDVTCAELVYAKGNIVDTAAEKGILTAQDYFFGDAETALPIYNGTGYSFFDVAVATFKNGESINTYGFNLNTASADFASAVALLGAGVAASRVQPVAEVAWSDAQGKTNRQTIVFGEDLFAGYLADAENKLIAITVSGVRALGAQGDVTMTLKFVATDASGKTLAAVSGSAKTLTPEPDEVP